MKRKVITLMGAALLTPVLLFSGVAAIEGSSTSGSSTTTTTTTSGSTQTEKSDDKGMLERLAARKAERKTKLTAIEQKHLQTVCKSAQGKASSTEAKVKGLSTSRTEIYKNLTTRLNELVTKLQTKNVDVTQLQSEITQLKTLIGTFNTDMATYKQDVTDLVALDCNSDPVAFKASLDTARIDRDKAIADSAAIKAYVGTIKVTLQGIRSQLASTEDTTTPTSPATPKTKESK